VLPNKIDPLAENELTEDFCANAPSAPPVNEGWFASGMVPSSLEGLGLSRMNLEPIEACEDAANQMVALEEMFIAQRRRLRSFVRKRIGDENLAEDIVQQTFLGAYRSWKSFRGDSAPETWLFGIAMNLIRDLTSRSPGARIKFVPEEEIEEEPAPELDPMHICMRAQFSQKLHHAVANLPEDMAKTLQLVAEEGMTYQQTADALGIPIGTVRSRISRARASLKTLMDKYLE
jgi:RNA polymerase sigma-70 factor (ECF subfamily)